MSRRFDFSGYRLYNLVDCCGGKIACRRLIFSVYPHPLQMLTDVDADELHDDELLDDELLDEEWLDDELLSFFGRSLLLLEE